jgi:protein-disulfide isomerase
MADSSTMSKQSAVFGFIVVAAVAFWLGRTSVQSQEKGDPAAQPQAAADANKAADKPAAKKPDAAPAKAAAAPASDIKRPGKGPEDALVTIYEVSDFQCPFCSRVNPTMKQIQDTYGKDVRIEWVHQPLSFHNRALPAAKASTAAGMQGKFWEMHDKLFANQRDLTDANFLKWAGELKLDVAKFKADMARSDVEKYALRDQRIATALGARGTPGFFINGKFLSGARPFDAFKTEIDTQIAAVKVELNKGVGRAQARENVTAKNNAKLVDYILKGKEPPAAPAPAPKKEADNKPRPIDPTVYKVPVSPKDPFMGSKDALVTIVEFSEFQCPFCKRVGPTLKKIKEEYGDKVRVVFKGNPLSFHKDARPATYASLAAHEQGKFWEMHDKLFENNTSLKRDNFIQHAKDIGLDVAKFTKAFDEGSKRYDAQIAVDQKIASDVQAQGTPNFFVNGRKMTGARPFEDFKALIDEEMAKAKKLAGSGVSASKVYAKIIEKGKVFEALDSQVQDIKTDGLPTYGAKKARITLVEYSDFQCPYCSRVGPTMKQVVDMYKGNARLIFKQFPLSFHKQARPAAKASLAAHRQGKFWEMHDLIFENQRALADDLYEKLAGQLGLDAAKFKKDFADPKIDAAVNEDFREGQRVGVRGTPTFFINGRKYQAPDRSAEGIKKVIDSVILGK